MLNCEEILLELNITTILIPFSCAMYNKCQEAFSPLIINCFLESASIYHMQISCFVDQMCLRTVGSWLLWIDLESTNYKINILQSCLICVTALIQDEWALCSKLRRQQKDFYFLSAYFSCRIRLKARNENSLTVQPFKKLFVTILEIEVGFLCILK